jgi:hypothetical protein
MCAYKLTTRASILHNFLLSIRVILRQFLLKASLEFEELNLKFQYVYFGNINLIN